LTDEEEKKSRYYIDGSSQSNFVGREGLLLRLKAKLLPKDDGQKEAKRRIFVMHGLGGTGKTQVALKFAEENRDR
jgi:hypothetical protein